MLLVPTATMAQHLRNHMAREGLPLRPRRVQTLAQFVEDWAGPAKSPPSAILPLLVESALARLSPPEFRQVTGYPGFHAAVATLLEELSSTGCAFRGLEELAAAPFGPALAAVYHNVAEQLAAHGFAFRDARLATAAAALSQAPLPLHRIFLDGFSSLTTPELRVLDALSRQASITIALPDWEGARNTRRALLDAGYRERRFDQRLRQSQTELFTAATLDQEAAWIVRQILDEAKHGRAFREIGVVTRSREPYADALCSAFQRFGIPARFYFVETLGDHAAVRYLAGILDALLSGWDHAETLSVLRVPVAGLGGTSEGDRFDFAIRERLPGLGLTGLLAQAGEGPVRSRIEQLQSLEPWLRGSAPPSEWASRFRSLQRLFPSPVIPDGLNRERAMLWRSFAAARDAFHLAIEDAAAALASRGALSLADFWSAARSVLARTPLRVPDQRHNVVHVMDAYEARQWELPVIFVCGLLERHFPQYHRQDPLLPDAARVSFGLPTSAQRHQEERFLFDLATSRATHRLFLSYPRFNDKGEDNLPSFFLNDLQPAPVSSEAVRVRPAPHRPRAAVPASAIHDPQLLAQIVLRHKTLAPTGIESYLQCPFQFFARKTLALKERPPEPKDRLDPLAQGSILHGVLARLADAPLFPEALFDSVFSEECRRRNIPLTYRTEAVRLELLRHLRRFLADRQLSLSGWSSRFEQSFEFALDGNVRIRGRIDRLDSDSSGRALVIDYKYSGAGRIRDSIERNNEGTLVQGGLYLLAAERAFQLKPAGMLYCGLRKNVTWEGWHLPIAGLEEVGESRTPAALRELIETALSHSLQAFEGISTGRVKPEPADRDKCEWCEFRDICRIAAAQPAHFREAGSGSDLDGSP